MSRPRRGLDPAFWIADADRDEKRFVVRANEKLTAFLELERRFSLAWRGTQKTSA
jgi:hypothetical protein